MPRSFVLLLACAGFALPVLPSVLQQMSMEQMTAASTEIVQGTVSASYTAMGGNTIFTHYTIQVTQRMKGPNNPTTDVAIPGGSLKGLRQSFPGMPVLNVGGNYMLFLWQGKTGPNQPVGLNQEAMLGADGKPVMDRGVRMRMVDLRSRVASALTTGMSAALPPVQASAGVAK
jgi:hypothetical protein